MINLISAKRSLNWPLNNTQKQGFLRKIRTYSPLKTYSQIWIWLYVNAYASEKIYLLLR